MSMAKVSRFLVLLAVSAIGGAFFPDTGLGQTAFQYPPYGALRGRMVSRDGVYRVQRYRWGGGITPQGAAFLTSAVNAVVPMIPSLIGRGEGGDSDADGGTRNLRDFGTREPNRFTAPNDYVVAQQEANALLASTAALVGYTTPKSDSARPPIDELLKWYKAPEGNPWGNGKTGPAASDTKPPLEKLLRLYKAPEGNPWDKKK